MRSSRTGRPADKIVPNRPRPRLSSASPLSALAAALHRYDPTWIHVGRIYRRVCFLRLEGRAEEAGQLEATELAQAEARALGPGPADPEAEAALRGLLAEEEGRVAEAIAFAEVLIPALSSRPAAAAPTAPRRPAARTEAPGIADFIDEMLVRERPGSR